MLSFAQSYVLPDVAPLPEVKGHYAKMMQLPVVPDPAFAHLDAITYPAARASGYALIATDLGRFIHTPFTVAVHHIGNDDVRIVESLHVYSRDSYL